ncbi:hypothetical protein AAHC03_022927 [Spirometra sp. Aus1]
MECYHRIFPKGFWLEFKALGLLALPIMMTCFVGYILAPVSLVFCGKLGKSELASAGLAVSIFHTAGVSLVTGLLTAGETLFAQTYGGSNKFRMGVQLQRACCIIFLCCSPCIAIYICIEPILLATGQPPQTSKSVAEYLLRLIPGLYSLALYEILSKYVQSQNKVMPPLIAGIFGIAANATSHYVLLFHVNMGLLGSAFAQSLGFMTEALALLAYVIFSGMYRKTWNGIRIELWHDWGTWMRLGIAGLIMSGMEWWVCESGNLVAGILSERELAVQTILNNVESIVYFVFPLGFALATTIRIGQYLGANDSTTPRATACVGFIAVLTSAVVSVVLLTSLRFEIPKIFSNDPGVLEMTSQYFPSVIAFQFFDAINGINGGIVRGVGKQKIGAVVCCACMYLIAGPAGLSLMFLTPLGVSGFWWGLSMGSFVQSIVYTTLCARIDWAKECERAAKRTVIKFVGDNEEVQLSNAGSPDEMRDTESASEDSSEKEEKEEEPVQRCPPRVLFTRFAFVSLMVLMVAVSVSCRLLLDWSDYFPSYCLLRNSSLLPIPKRSERMARPEAFQWLQRDCLDILPSQ